MGILNIHELRKSVPNAKPNPCFTSEKQKQGDEGRIGKNLGKRSLKITEALSILDQDQIDKIRSANTGNFKENSRYIVNKDEAHTMYIDENIDSATEEAVPKANRPYIRLSQTLEDGVQGLKDTALRSV